MNDDLNTAKVIAEMFGVQGLLQKLSTEPSLLNQVPAEAIQTLAQDYIAWFSDILGLLPESGGEVNGRKDEALAGLVEILIQQRKDAKAAKDFEKADAIRKQLEGLHIYLKDSREGVSWTYEPDREI